MQRDDRYEIIRAMLDQGKIKTLNDIFKYVPKTVVAKNIGKKVARFTRAMHNPEEFTLQELFRIGELCDLDEWEITRLAVTAHMVNNNIKSNSHEIP